MTVQQNSRSVARPNRFEPGTSGRMVGKSTPLPPKSISLHYENVLRYYAFFIKFTRNEGYYAISQLICFGDLYWARLKVEERKLETKVHKLKMKLHEDLHFREQFKANWVQILAKDNKSIPKEK